MGFFGDLKQLRKTADQLAPDRPRGMLGGLRGLSDALGEANQLLSDVAARQQQAKDLQENGRVGQATITKVEDTGLTVNENPQVRLELMVSVEGGEPYPVAVTLIISRLAVATYQPGATISVRVDPANPQALVVA